MPSLHLDLGPTNQFAELRRGVRQLCDRFPGTYWQRLDAERGYPVEFVGAMTESGFLAALIPEDYGGGGASIAEASVILEEVNRSGGNAGVCHAQMYIMGALVRHGSPAQKERWLPPLAEGRLRLQAFGVTEPNAGSDTTSIQTRAERDGDEYVISGQKIWTSRAQHSDLMLLLARTTPLEKVTKRTAGLSLFLVDLRNASGRELTIRPLETMINHHTTEVFFEGLRVPAENRIGAEGKGFRYILDGMNAERILIAAESIGDGGWFIERAVDYANQRIVFDRPIGQNQGVQFPIAQAYANLRAADLMRWQAARLFDSEKPCGAEANMAKMLSADAAWEAANVCLQTHGGFGFAREHDVERKFREAKLYQIAPVSNNLVLSYLAQHVLGLPRSY
ncbi:MAG: acyl-CoA/acyl-ACP dehydrogenase [Caldilineaceae bacterium]|nr:acyl-CoA/acyl-ACP dehydrogenase [Caldilineaceae bacterium]